MVANTNFPAALQVLALLGTAFSVVVLGALAMYGKLTSRPWTKLVLSAMAVIVGGYILLLLAFSVASHERVLKVGQEKYFCEIDCHIAYSVAEVKWTTMPGSADPLLLVTMRTRFDPETISERRPKDVPLEPNPRVVTLLDSENRSYPMVNLMQLQLAPSVTEVPFGQKLIPGQSYPSTLGFRVPREAKGLKLLVATADGPEKILIGSELSLLHKKTFFEVSPMAEQRPGEAR